LRDGMYNDLPLEAAQSLFRSARQQLDVAGLPYGRDSLWRSRIEYLIARAFQSSGQKNTAIRHYECGLAFADQAVASGLEAEGWHLKGEHLGQLCLLKDVSFLVSNGNKVRESVRRALSLDPANVSCQILLAADKIYSPRIFGGDALAGIELMQQALRMGAVEKDDLFNIYSGIGAAYLKLHDYEAAKAWFGKALQIYPNNCYASERYRSITD
jgi:tetratricopeptide (TPR) repeat protein